MEMTDDSSCMSAPTSPRRISLEVGGLCFFSVPTSPTKRTLKAAYEDSSSNGDEFEFETSRRFNVGECEVESKQKPKSQPEEPLPDMAFADELFYDGKVVPLKPPPRLQYHHKQSSSLSPTRSPSSGLRFPFQRRSLWNDDFDPFMAALKNVKKEKAGRSQAKSHRRARSMSPFREKETNGLMLPTKQSNSNSDKTIESKEQAKERQLKLAEPKGVIFARRVRLVNVGNGNKPREASVAIGKQQTKGQKMKKLLSRSGSVSNENKGTWSENGTEARPKLKRKFSLKAMGIAPYKEEKRLSDSQATLATLIQYRPKLLLCMGYGAKYVK
ncbi:hypothetical protein HRI_003134200 [Hibiscus trionum]|uniref:Uncharacterized protein n=1 Tax=Hibiscus trionum TaxID=183268 RepID=A0A9W7ID04_HIBTR|nr:hypothetical protein HRI_003134200 [Hibiscus trionum]